MPWKVSSVMEERLRFVGHLLDGQSMSDVCREFGISRKTGYKIYSRYREHGLFALTDRSRTIDAILAWVETTAFAQSKPERRLNSQGDMSCVVLRWSAYTRSKPMSLAI
jgi:transposase-like protein